MAHRIGSNGHVVIPEALRKTAGLKVGDEITFSVVEGGILIARRLDPDAIMGRLAGRRLVEALERDRRAERRR